MVRSRYARGAVEVRLCASSTLTDAVPVLPFLSGGTVILGGVSEFIRIIGDPDNRGSHNRGSTVYRSLIIEGINEWNCN